MEDNLQHTNSKRKKLQHTSDKPSKLPFQLIKQITNNFDEERVLGSGGFGTVYKGVHENGQQIAVKVLHNISGGLDKEFQKEFDNLRGLKHQNVVELVGFCNELEEELVEYQGKKVTAVRMRAALCFEYVHNGSLHKRISDECTGLKWHTRYKVIKGVCEGLKYLREGLESPIMHFDLKPGNILLDKNMIPKIADFGLSRLFGEQNTTKTMSTVGTCGYWPPEYVKHQVISKEFDIFSLGVIIVKIMTGHEGYLRIADMTNRKFVNHVYENWKRKLGETMSVGQLEVYCNQVKRCIEIALDCLKQNRQERPTIQYIVSRLDDTETLIGGRGLQIEQYHKDDAESILLSKSSITTGSSSGHGEASRCTNTENRPAVKPLVMPLHLLKDMTNDFSEERLIRRDFFGKVYKGVYGDGQVIAVRLLRYSIKHGVRNFQHEITKHMIIHHQNILQLVGYCSETKSSITVQNRGHVISDKTNRVLCFEYLPNGSLDQYISGLSCGLDWNTRYGIIKSTCEGIRYLHEGLADPIIHMNLKPSNILLDENMVSKLDNPVVRLCYDVNSMVLTGSIAGTMEYIPPEFIQRQVISKQYDIYSLGVVIVEIVTGKRYYAWDVRFSSRDFDELVKDWRKRLEETVNETLVESYCQQVEKCLEIALECVRSDRLTRPSIGNIINHIMNKSEHAKKKRKRKKSKSEILEHPQKLFFSSMSGMRPSSCSLQLKNRGDDRVAFMLLTNKCDMYLTKKPLCGVVPPRCAYTLILTMLEQELPSCLASNELRRLASNEFTLYSIMVGKYDLLDVGEDDSAEYNIFFQKAKQTVDEVKEVTLKAIRHNHVQLIRPAAEIITTAPDAQQVSSMDVHPTEPWIMTTHQLGSLRVWNYHTMATLNSIQDITDEPVHSARFIARNKWVVAGDGNGCIHVYNYDQNQLIHIFDAHEGCITTMAVHPTDPFVLSSSDDDNDHLIKLWDWSKGWKCTRTFQGHTDRVTQVTFNPEDKDSFASVSWDGTVKIWSICSDNPSNIITLKLDGCVESLLCVDYFTRYARQHLIVGCKDRTAQIWKLGMKGCFDKLEGHANCISAVNLHPELLMLITGSLDGTIRIWNSTTYKLENIISFNLGAVYALGCIKGSRRIMAGCHQGIATMELSTP